MPHSPSDRLNSHAVLTVDRALLRGWPLPKPAVEGDKEARGRVLVIGGARQMPGAIILAATAALRAGAGKLQIATVKTVAPLVAAAVPEALVHALPESRDGGLARKASAPLRAACANSSTILLGPGVIENDALKAIVVEILSRLNADQTVVLDAGALTALAGHRPGLAKFKPTFVVTPHAGEMATLLGRAKPRVVARPLDTAVDAAKHLSAITVLKGAQTIITDGTRTFRNTVGNVGLATSGSGDVLAGIIAGLAARGAKPLQAAVWGVFLHASAGDVLAKRIGPMGYLARELSGEVPALMARFG